MRGVARIQAPPGRPIVRASARYKCHFPHRDFRLVAAVTVRHVLRLRDVTSATETKARLLGRRSDSCLGVGARVGYATDMNSRRDYDAALRVPGSSAVRAGTPATASKPQERREGVRYALHARVVFGWTEIGGQKRESRGHTRNVAQKGTFIMSPDCPPRDTPITLTIFLPVNAGEKRMIRMAADGRVTRAEQPEGQPYLNGFAVSHCRMNLFGG
jgi:hypothetical protein